MNTRFPFADWFRNSSPYINAHRGRTFVVLIEGEALASERWEPLLQDLALLHTLGVRLVMVFGIRPQVGEALSEAGIEPRRIEGRWVADESIMRHVERIAAELRLKIEARLSLGLPNTPLHGVELTVVSGNLVTAKPLGVRDGIDFHHSGEVRRVRSQAIADLLAKETLVLVPPLGYSSTGEVFDLDAADVAQHVAMGLGADKLILLGDAAGLHDASGMLQRSLPRWRRIRYGVRRRRAANWRVTWARRVKRRVMGWPAHTCFPGMIATPCLASCSPAMGWGP